MVKGSKGKPNKHTWTRATAPRVGRKPGTKNKSTILRTNVELIAAQKHISPLEVLSGMAADDSLSMALRERAATSAAPYVHRRMPQAVEIEASVKLVSSFAEAVKSPPKKEKK